jgi:hypothetical protein
MPEAATFQFYTVAPKVNPSNVVHICLTCAVRGVDEDMTCKAEEWKVSDAADTLRCEACGEIIVEVTPNG